MKRLSLILATCLVYEGCSAVSATSELLSQPATVEPGAPQMIREKIAWLMSDADAAIRYGEEVAIRVSTSTTPVDDELPSNNWSHYIDQHCPSLSPTERASLTYFISRTQEWTTDFVFELCQINREEAAIMIHVDQKHGWCAVLVVAMLKRVHAASTNRTSMSEFVPEIKEVCGPYVSKRF